MSPSSWLITGANRGIGRGLVETLVQRPNTTVIAAVRDPKAASNDLKALAQTASNGSKVIVVKIRSTSETDAAAAVEELKRQGINKLDVVIANAGISNCYEPVISTPIDQVREHFEVNTVGTLVLFQAVWPLLEQSLSPKFIYVTSAAGSIAAQPPVPWTAYGMSKAAGNYVVVKIHQEHPSLTAFAIHPGLVQTDMGETGAKAIGQYLGVTGASLSVVKSVEGILNRIDSATRESSGGTFKDFEKEDWAW